MFVEHDDYNTLSIKNYYKIESFFIYFFLPKYFVKIITISISTMVISPQ